jgi:flagella basal body P-ring formation protein FlgA
MLNRNQLTISLSLLLAGGLLVLAQAAANAVEISEAMLREKVTEHVRERLKNVISANDQAFLMVDIPRIPSAPLVFPSVGKASDIAITTDSALGGIYSDRGVVRVRLSTPDGLVKTLGVPVELRVRKPVWVSKTTINAGQPLRSSDFELQTRDVSYNYAYAVGNERPLGQYVARVNMRPGEVLDNRKLSIPPDVRYNDEVRIVMASHNGMTLVVPGVAMENARIGDTIRVRQSNFQRKYYTAKVIDKNRVLVEM